MGNRVLLINNVRGVVTITLNRPEVRNALSPEMVVELTSIFEDLKKQREARVVVITGAGKAFCAGADLNWMSRVVDFSFAENVHDSVIISRMLQAVHQCYCPVIAKVNGPALGGGMGLVAACDISIGCESSFFALRETQIGLIPAIIYPFLQARIENRYLREYFLTGERFYAEKAMEMGLLNHSVSNERLDEKVELVIKELLTGAPFALQEAKKLLNTGLLDLEGARQLQYAELIAHMRLSSEGQEGMKAFLEKRKPHWIKD